MKRFSLIVLSLFFMSSNLFASYSEALKLFQKKEYKEALAIVAGLLSVDQDLVAGSPNYKLRYLAAHIHWKLGNTESAIAHFKRCMDINKETADPCIDLSLLLFELKRYKDADTYVQKGLKIKEDPMLYNILGRISLGYKNYWRAKEFFEKSISLDAEMYASYNGLGMALMNLKKYTEADTAFSAALALKIDSPEILNNKALCLEKLEKYNESLNYLLKAKALEPENNIILANIKRVENLRDSSKLKNQ